jgi:hypothetical protein
MNEIFPGTVRRLNEWMAQPEVLGVIHVGSKSRNYVDELSDDDLEVVITDEAYAPLTAEGCLEYYYEGEGSARKQIYDAQYITPAVLARKIRSPHDLDHWPYEQAQILFDRDQSIGAAVRAIKTMDPHFRQRRLLHAAVDAWLAVDRGKKMCRRGGAEISLRLVMARGAKAVARLIFGLEGRWVPFDYSLEPELQRLPDPTRSAEYLLKAVAGDSPDLLGESLDRLEDRLYAEGVPRRAGRFELFCELVHHSISIERELYGLYY